MGHSDNVVEIVGAIGSIFMAVYIIEIWLLLDRLHKRKLAWNLLNGMQQYKGTVTTMDWRNTLTHDNPEFISAEETLIMVAANRPFDLLQPPKRGEEDYHVKLKQFKEEKTNSHRKQRLATAIRMLSAEVDRRDEEAEMNEDDLY